MPRQALNNGSAVNDGTGAPIRTLFGQLNDMTAELYADTGGDLLVASATAPDRVKDVAQYVADGTGDQDGLNAALAALPATGGRVRFWGQMNVTGAVLLTGSGQTLEGVGTGHRGNASQSSVGSRITVSSGFSGTEVVRVQLTSNDKPAHGVRLAHFTVDGAGVGSGVDGILFRAHTSHIDDVHVTRATGNGFRLRGYDATAAPPSGWATYDTTMVGLKASYCAGAGVWFDEFAQDCHVLGSIFYYNLHNIRVSAASQQITGCHTYSATDYNVWFDSGGSRTKIVNLKCEQAGKHGVYFDGTVAGTSDIQIVGCNFKNNGETTDNTYDHVHFVGGGGSHSRVSVVGCNFSWTSGNKARYGINLNSSTAAANVNIQANSLSGTSHFATAPVNHPSTVTGTVRGNVGHVGAQDSVVLVGAADGTKRLWFGGTSQPGGMVDGDYWIKDA